MYLACRVPSWGWACISSQHECVHHTASRCLYSKLPGGPSVHGAADSCRSWPPSELTLPVCHAGKLPQPDRAYILKPIDGKLTYVRRGKNVRRDESDAIQQADLFLQGISLQLSSEFAGSACLALSPPACAENSPEATAMVSWAEWQGAPDACQSCCNM